MTVMTRNFIMTHCIHRSFQFAFTTLLIGCTVLPITVMGHEYAEDIKSPWLSAMKMASNNQDLSSDQNLSHVQNINGDHHISIDLSQTTAKRILAYQQRASALSLEQHLTWQQLYYAKTAASGVKQSEVKYAGFFLNTAEPFDLAIELNLAIAALLGSEQSDQAFQCRFPARSQWLIQQLNIPADHLPVIECDAFSNWYQQINPHKVTLIYATDFMGNPSSMFGHTLLRIDPKDQAQLNLVSYAVNYAATVQGHDNWSYAWKGLTGQYPGEYSLMPYYQKVKEYADFESRDLWEYELELTTAQSQFLVMHLWELQQVSFPYYFIDDNCAYRLLGLIDLVQSYADLNSATKNFNSIQPKQSLQAQFKYSAVPVETIKAIQQQGLVRDTVYRPALETQLLAQSRQHGRTLAQQAHQLSKIESSKMAAALKEYDSVSQAKILEMAYDDLYLQFIARSLPAEQAQPRLRTLLILRSQIDIDKQRQVVPRPKQDPTQSHDARYWSLSVGRVQDQNVIQLGQRQAYHDLVDPQAGLRTGTQMQFLDGAIGWRDDRLKVESLTLLSVNSYNPIHAFKSPLSWGFNGAWQQESVHQGQFSSTHQHGVMSLKAQAGYSVASQDNQNLCYIQAQGYVQAGKSLEQGARVGMGPTAGCQNIWSERINSLLQVELPYWHDTSAWNWRIHSAVQYVINPQNAFRINIDYQQQQQRDWFGMRLGYYHYF